jgi:hypothetical protein
LDEADSQKRSSFLPFFLSSSSFRSFLPSLNSLHSFNSLIFLIPSISLILLIP